MKPVYLLVGIPIAAVLLGPFLLNRVHPFILGMPFLLGWFTLSLIATSLIMALIYHIDGPSAPTAEDERKEGRP